ncbi:tRNA lysidine(34) synthetase TilS [uncultured Muriicola sp.]|uniref:tRNA lysidine(34) synthetase TilS n=1 Tax=uncultured Muriicola sp. TaxID=1583102 RepID=UPI00260C5E71|nr:tRNA lysidine(34) synthetase TilS [uncultured Muriicola sp.]
MFNAFKDHIEKNFPQLLRQPGAVACSGGLDSIVLTHLCSQMGMQISLAHCNFKLRAGESEEDELFIKQLAEQLNIPQFITHFNTNEYASKNKLSIQMAARELRYQWFTELMDKEELSWVLTAHHLDDSLETFLINLSRGTGIEGLSGIPPNSNGIIRPLLPFSRAEIMEYAQEEGFAWREDSTNEETKYLRNKIRHELVPVLKELHPTFLENFKKTEEYLSDSAKLLSDYSNELKEKLFVPYHQGFKIAVSSLEELNPLQGYLYELFKEYGFHSWKDMESLLSAMSGKEVHSKTHRLIKDRKHLILYKLQDKYEAKDEGSTLDELSELPIELKIEKVEQIEEKNNTILYVDKETLNHRLTVRKWKKGDYFYPLGMDGQKKVAKFYKDEKMDAVAKENQWLLCCGDEIVWIIGRRADNRFKITALTKNILKVTVAE